MNANEFLELVNSTIDPQLQNLGSVEKIGDEIRIRPALMWEMQNEYFFVRLTGAGIFYVGFQDDDLPGHVVTDPVAVIGSDAWQSIDSAWHELSSEGAMKCAKTIINYLQTRIRVSGQLKIYEDKQAESVYILGKWLRRRDGYMLKALLTRYSENMRKIVREIARLAGWEEVARIEKNMKAAEEIR